MSNVFQNLIIQHADIQTFIKHYFLWQVTTDTVAIVHSLTPQYTLMQTVCRMSRWIDPDWLQELTPEQSLSVNQHPYVCRLIVQQEK
jgi:hypothetical protein